MEKDKGNVKGETEKRERKKADVINGVFACMELACRLAAGPLAFCLKKGQPEK